MKTITLTLFVLLLTSCAAHSDADRYVRLVEEWQGRTIEFPSVMVDVATGDTIDTGEADFILLTYVDTAGCTSCRMRLPIWTYFLESLDTLTDNYEVLPLILVNAKNDSILSYIIHRDGYNYPVIIDKADSLNLLNQFPEEPTFRSFLLNNEQKIIAIGNPTVNDAIADLYRSIISGSRTFSGRGRQVVAATPSSVSLGEISMSVEHNVDFYLENQSGDTVYISDITTSCHCTTAFVADTIIPPGTTLPIKVTLREDSVEGDFARSVYVYYRNFDNPTVLHIFGTIN